MRHRSTLLALAFVAAAQAGFAQQAAVQAERPETFLGRFSFGGRLSILGSNLMNSDQIRRSTSEPAVATTTLTESNSKRVGGGLTLEFAISDRLSIGADFLYRRAGYNRTIVRVEGVDDEDTSAVESKTTQDIEDTRADFWDVPIVARYYNKSRRSGGSRAFALAGVAFRRASAVRTLREVVRADSLSDTYDTAVQPAHANIGGLVLGGGVQLADDLRFKFTPEFRYTRWLRSTFDNAPTRSSKHQLEIVLGLTF